MAKTTTIFASANSGGFELSGEVDEIDFDNACVRMLDDEIYISLKDKAKIIKYDNIVGVVFKEQPTLKNFLGKKILLISTLNEEISIYKKKKSWIFTGKKEKNFMKKYRSIYQKLDNKIDELEINLGDKNIYNFQKMLFLLYLLVLIFSFIFGIINYTIIPVSGGFMIGIRLFVAVTPKVVRPNSSEGWELDRYFSW